VPFGVRQGTGRDVAEQKKKSPACTPPYRGGSSGEGEVGADRPCGKQQMWERSAAAVVSAIAPRAHHPLIQNRKGPVMFKLGPRGMTGREGGGVRQRKRGVGRQVGSPLCRTQVCSAAKEKAVCSSSWPHPEATITAAQMTTNQTTPCDREAKSKRLKWYGLWRHLRARRHAIGIGMTNPPTHLHPGDRTIGRLKAPADTSSAAEL
jgi:hypothetical protein